MSLRAVVVALVCLALPGAAGAEEAPDYQTVIAEAQAAFAAEDWSMLSARLDEAQALRPYSLSVWRNRILARSLLGDYDEALQLVDKIAARGLSISIAGHPAFDALKSQPGYAAIEARMTANVAPIGAADIWAEHADDAMLPEAVAYDTKRKQAYVGSVRSGGILRIDAEGKARPFAQAPGGVYAIDIDAGLLWAAANAAPPFSGETDANGGAGVHAYSLSDGALLQSYVLDGDAATLGALARTPAGLVVSDSGQPRLLILRKGADALEMLPPDARFVNLQGLAYDRTRRKLYVADYLAGLFAIDLKTGAATPLANPADAHLGGVDGLVAYKGDLIGIQNGVAPQRIVRIGLNRKGDAVERFSVLQQNLAEWNEPTNGAVIDDSFVYVATSNWPAYAADGALNDEARREPLRLMHVRLD